MDNNSKKPRKKISLSNDFLFGKRSLSTKSKSVEENELIQIAAVLDKFKVDQIMAVAGSQNSESHMDELISSSSIAGYDGNTPWYELEEPIRRNALKQFLNRSDFRKEITRIQKHDDLSLSSYVVLRFLKGEFENLEEYSVGQLTILAKAAKWVSQLNLGYPTHHEIYTIMGRKEFLQPLKDLTQNFQGREKELRQIKNYVDWLPKEGLLEKTADFFRKAFSWHDKKPMLITGIGGIGKSTLVAKFIRDHLEGKKKYPFIYIDFDNSVYSIEEPLFLLLVAFKQLKLQYPRRGKVFDDLIEILNDKVFNERQILSGERSTRSFRNTVYESLIRRLARHKLSLADIDKPILTVFDSFEELQYRGANKAEFDVFMNTIQEISERIPRLRPIFVGRAEIKFREIKAEATVSDPLFKEIEFETIILDSFDLRSSSAYLESLGVKSKTLRRSIYGNFGGNPLTLQLAAALVKENQLSDLKRVGARKKGMFFQKLEQESIQRELVKRNLDHIHDPEVRKIAMPGLLVRKVDAEIIAEVLAEPCGLGEISLDYAKEIYELLKQETFLIQTSSDTSGIVFRQDLRRAMEDMVVKMDPENSRKIHDNAVAYYAEKSKPEHQAEYIFHRLKRGDAPHFFNKTIYNSVAPHLDRSLDELPLEAQVYIASLRGSKISQDKLRAVNIEEWEKYQAKIIRDGLKADLSNLRVLADEELNLRPERTFNSALTYWEARLYQRLYELEKADQLAKKAAAESENSEDVADRETHLQSKILLIENLEYRFEFEKAFEELEKIPLDAIKGLDDLIALQLEVLGTRLRSRLEIHEELVGDFTNWEIDFAKNDTYKRYESYYRTLLFDETFPYNALAKRAYRKNFERFRGQFSSREDLENFAHQYLGGSLSGLTEPAHYEVILRDIYNRTNEENLREIFRAEETGSSLRRLARILADLYPSVDAAVRILTSAGISLGQFDFRYAAATNWYNILSTLRRRGMQDDLLQVVQTEYPGTFQEENEQRSSNPKLSNKLAELFSTEKDIRKILKYAKLPPESQFIANAAAVNWQNILDYAESQRHLDDLLQTAIDFSGDDELVEIINSTTSVNTFQDSSKLIQQEQAINKNRLLDLLSKDRLDRVIEMLYDLAQGSSLHNSIVALNARNNVLREREQMGILTPDNVNVERYKLRSALLYYIDELTEQQATASDRSIDNNPSSEEAGLSGINVPSQSDFERVVGSTDDILPIEWLHKALEQAKIVCKVALADDHAVTGILVKGGYVLTTCHAVCQNFVDEKKCFNQCEGACGKEIEFVFDYEHGKEPITYSADSSQKPIINKQLDYALIKLSDDPNNPLSQRSYAELDPFSEIRKDDLVTIIQHPEGSYKKIAAADRVISVWRKRNHLFYQADTRQGSSGAPVFDRSWKVVALHQGTTSMEENRRFTINEEGDVRAASRGTLMSAILENLASKGIKL